MTDGAVTWFYWPITFAVAATIAAFLLYRTARYYGKTHRKGLVLGLCGALAASAPVVTIGLGLYARCADNGHLSRVRPAVLILALIILLGWLAALWLLFWAAGMAPVESQRPPTRIFLFMVPAMIIEFGISTISLEEYCFGDPSWMNRQLLAAVVLPVVGVLFLAMIGREKAE